MPKKKPQVFYQVTSEILDKVEKMASQGYYNTEIARALDWSIDTFYERVKDHPDFSDALKKGNEKNVRVTLNSKAKKIKGFKYKEVTKERDENGNLIITKQVTKYSPPSDTMIIFDLVNRDPENYKHKRDQTNIVGDIIIKTDSDDDQL